MNLLFETKYALRKLLKVPFHSAICIFIIASSIAIALIIYAFMYQFGIKPLEVDKQEQWYLVEYLDTDNGLIYNYPTLDHYTYSRIQSLELPNVEHIGGIKEGYVTLSDGDISVALSSMAITPGTMEAFGITPHLGRVIRKDDGENSSQAVVMLSYDTWQTNYYGRTDIIGQQTRINGQTRIVVGVLPKGFNLVNSAHVWLPFNELSTLRPDPEAMILPLLKFTNTEAVSTVDQTLKTLFSRIKSEFPSSYQSNYQLKLIPSKLSDGSENSASSYILMVILAGTLILLGCLNIGTLLYARLLERRQELGIRNAIGSSPWRLIKESLSESVLLSLAGCLLGSLIAFIGFKGFNFFIMQFFAGQGSAVNHRYLIEFDAWKLLTALLVTFAIWFCGCFIPSVRASKQNINLIANSGKGTSSFQGFKTTAVLVGFQVSFACFLLILSGSMLVLVDRMVSRSYGVNTNNLATGEIQLQSKFIDIEQRLLYLNELEQALVDIPGVQSIAFTTALPGRNPTHVSYRLEDRDIKDNNAYPTQPHGVISTNYFEVTKINVLEGEAFDPSHTLSSLPVVIIDERFADLYWPDQSPIGKRIQINPNQSNQWQTIVGVSKHVVTRNGILPDTEAVLYTPLSQTKTDVIRLVIRHNLPLAQLNETILKTATSVDGDLAISNMLSIQDLYDSNTGIVSIFGDVFLAIALITFILAVIGIFAVITRTVVLRTQDIGVRRALGSSKNQVIRLFLGKAAWYLVVGSSIGVSLAFLTNSTLFSNFSGWVPSSSLYISLIVVLLLAISVFAAAYIPSWKATQLEPGDALRYE